LKNEIEGKKKEKNENIRLKRGNEKKSIDWMMKLKIKKKNSIYTQC